MKGTREENHITRHTYRMWKPHDYNNRHVKTFTSDVYTETLYKYPDPVSPHIATDKVL